ncbi:MAG: hypothetical protein QOD13_2857 [Thermoleophilaceae bacterium]|jgi:2-desacetyl-2-hydroxyethyl bacteriochlorophyllide A dehydrogenase|nr:hypothetical protein [Thermoleophilaceae bacterium]
MKAAVFHGSGELRVDSVPQPRPGPDEVLVRVHRCGICGTDLHIVGGSFRTPNLPLIIGHEFAGEVVEAGPDAGDLKPGDRVTADINIACGRCYFCRKRSKLFCPSIRQLGVHTHGGMAEYVAVPAANVYRLPGGMSFEQGAYVEPLSCAIHGQRRVGVDFGDTVAIIGAGSMGLAHVALSKLSGAGQVIVTEPHEGRRALAQRLGADLVLDPTGADVPAAVADATDGRGADVVIEAVGAVATYADAFAMVRAGGRLLAFGATAPDADLVIQPFDIFARELTIVGSYASAYEAWPDAISLIESGAFDPGLIVDSVRPLSAIGEAFEELTGASPLVKAQVDTLDGAA